MAAVDVLAAWFGRNTVRWARQAIATLNANGYSVIRLPNPDPNSWWADEESGWAINVQSGRIRLTAPQVIRATDAQQLAAALIAAAHALGATE